MFVLRIYELPPVDLSLLSTTTVLAFTVILQVAFRPFVVFAVIVTVPAFFAVTLPLLFTVAILLLLEYHLTDFAAFSGEVVATRVFDCPTLREYFE